MTSTGDIAYHEAGHAAMFFLTRKKFTRVAIGGDDPESLGAVQRRPDKALLGFCNVSDHAERHILILVAGGVAVRHQAHRPNRDAVIARYDGQS